MTHIIINVPHIRTFAHSFARLLTRSFVRSLTHPYDSTKSTQKNSCIIYTYLSSETLITPSSPCMKIAAFISSAVPSNLLNNSGLFTVLNRSFALRGAGFISAAIINFYFTLYLYRLNIKHVSLSIALPVFCRSLSLFLGSIDSNVSATTTRKKEHKKLSPMQFNSE